MYPIQKNSSISQNTNFSTSHRTNFLVVRHYCIWLFTSPENIASTDRIQALQFFKEASAKILSASLPYVAIVFHHRATVQSSLIPPLLLLLDFRLIASRCFLKKHCTKCMKDDRNRHEKFYSLFVFHFGFTYKDKYRYIYCLMQLP